MQKQKNTFIAGCITLAILAAMTGSINALQAKEKASKSVAKKKPGTANAGEFTTTKTAADVPVAAVTTTQTTPIVQPVTLTPAVAVPKAVGTPAPTPTPAPVPVPTPTYTYKNGTYPVTVTYNVPGRTASLYVSLNVVNDAVSASSVSYPSTTDPTSKNWDNRFINDYQQYVTGRPISSLHLSNTSGSSLTTTGFNNALDQIRSAAHS